AFGNMKWNLIECNQQRHYWECEYYVMKWMHHFVTHQQHSFSETVPWNDKKSFTTKELDDIKEKLAPRFVGPFEIVEKVGHVAYRIRLHEELNGVHDTFHVSNLKYCLADQTLQVPLDEIQVDAKFNFVGKPVEILEREFKKLNQSRIAIVKVRWNTKRGPEFTWEREDQMRVKACSDAVAFAYVILRLLLEVALCKCSSTRRPLGAYNLGVATPRALVYDGLMTSGDARLCIWKAFEANTRDLDSIWEETEQDCNSTRRLSKFGTQCVETASQSLVSQSLQETTSRPFLTTFK
nr:putative reverse transcriptase domain-containing protein [Tanacetum cinerariifolium]